MKLRHALQAAHRADAAAHREQIDAREQVFHLDAAWQDGQAIDPTQYRKACAAARLRRPNLARDKRP